MTRVSTILLSFACVLAAAQPAPAVPSCLPSEGASQRLSGAKKAEPTRSSEAERYEVRMLWCDEPHQESRQPSTGSRGRAMPPSGRESDSARQSIDPLAREILWADKGHHTPVFIPERVLETKSLDELPLDSIGRHFLQEQVRRFAVHGYGCDNPAEARQEQGSSEKTYSFEDLISQYPSAVVGSVIGVEPGWSNVHRHAAEAAYVQVDQVLFERHKGRAPLAGSVVGAIYPGGATTVGDTPICQNRNEGYYQPRTGDVVLIVGGIRPGGDPRHFIENMTFPLTQEGAIVSQPYMDLSEDARWMPLHDLRRALALRQLELGSER
jgi:hypothetical protein